MCCPTERLFQCKQKPVNFYTYSCESRYIIIKMYAYRLSMIILRQRDIQLINMMLMLKSQMMMTNL